MLERWARVSCRGRWAVLAVWLVAMAVGLLAMTGLPGLLTTSLSVPGTASQQADRILTGQFGENVEGTFTVVVPVPGSSGPAVARELGQRLVRAARVLPGGHVSAVQSGPGIMYADIATSLDLQKAAARTTELRGALARQGVEGAQVTGAPAFQHDISPVLSADLHRGEIIAVVAALVLLLAVLGLSWAVVVPFAVAAATTTTALALVWAVAHVVLMVLYVPNLVMLIGLGLAVDYSLLMVHRFREELSRPGAAGGAGPAAPVGRPGAAQVEQAVLTTVATAGRTVVLSGAGVSIGLAVLLVVDVPFVRALGVAGLLVPIVATAAAVTLQPALLRLLGRHALRPGARRPGTTAGGLWRRVGGGVLRHPGTVAALSVAGLAAAATPAAWLALTPGSLSAVPHDIGAWQGLNTLSRRVGPGVIGPVLVVVDAGGPGRATTPAMDAATLRLAHEVLDQPDVFVMAVGSRPPYTAGRDRYRQSVVVPRSALGAPASQRLVRLVRSALVRQARFPASAKVYVGGAPAQGVDFLDRVYGPFAWVALGAAVAAYLLLARALRSLLLPALAVLLDAVSVAAAYGLTVLVFRFGLGADLLGLYRAPQLEGWVPIFLFAMLFGLSMDYQVFFVSRMREAWDGGSGSGEAVVEGLAHTGRVVSTAALVMVAALSGMVVGRVAGLQELGVGLALGVVVDATVVRGLLMPALIALAGRWAWWLPAGVARLVRAKAPPFAGHEERGPGSSPPPPGGPVGGAGGSPLLHHGDGEVQ